MDNFSRISSIVQCISSVGILAVAIFSLQWAIATFRQREQHEAAREIPYYSMRIVTIHAPLEQLESSWFVLNDDSKRVRRWRNSTNLEQMICNQQVFSVNLYCLGPGMVSSAEVQYSVEIFDKPIGNQSCTEKFSGIFKFSQVLPGYERRATTGHLTTYYPYCRIKLYTPKVRDRKGYEVNVPPDSNLSLMEIALTNTQDNRLFWEAVTCTQSARPAEYR